MEGNFPEEELVYKLYSTVFDTYTEEFSVDKRDIHRAIIAITDCFKKYEYTKIHFYKKEFLCDYFYKYSTLYTAVARNRFLDAIDKCDTLRNTIKKSQLNIISLGGGPGTDLIGFLSALQEKEQKTNADFNILIVDLWRGWGIFYDIIEKNIREHNFRNVSKLFQSNHVSANFMSGDLRCSSSKYLLYLKYSDIVLLVRVLDVYSSSTQDIIIKNIARQMKSEALLLLIDTAVPYLDSIGLFNIYTSSLEEFNLPILLETKYGLPLPSWHSKAQITVYEKRKIRNRIY